MTKTAAALTLLVSCAVLVWPAVCGARRPPTSSELHGLRKAIMAYVKSDRYLAPHAKQARIIVRSVSTVDPHWADAVIEFPPSLHSQGVNLLMRRRGVHWHVVSAGGGFTCDQAPRPVLEDLYNGCLG